MRQSLSCTFSNEQLERITEEALIYMCACPAQVAEELLRLRRVFEYQNQCISKGSLLADAHRTIADSVRIAHTEMEHCLSEVLQLEGWDPETLKMPAGLRELRQKSIDQD